MCRDRYGTWATTFYWGGIRGLPWDKFYLGVPQKYISVHFELPGEKDHLYLSTFASIDNEYNEIRRIYCPGLKCYLCERSVPLCQLKGEFIRSPELLGNPVYEWGFGVHGSTALQS